MSDVTPLSRCFYCSLIPHDEVESLCSWCRVILLKTGADTIHELELSKHHITNDLEVIEHRLTHLKKALDWLENEQRRAV